MNKPIIVNAIEADAAVPVKLLAIQQTPQQFLKWLHSFEGTSLYRSGIKRQRTCWLVALAWS
jgi:hypothetical protein